MAPPIINVQSIPDGGMAIEVTLDAPWLASVLEGTEVGPAQGSVGSSGRASVRLDRDGADVIFTGSFEAPVSATCVACLEPVALALRGDFHLLLSPRKAGAHGGREEVELRAEELDADHYDDDRIDVGHWLREQILLEAPLHPRHEGDCPVALLPPVRAPHPGADVRPIDPRLAPLQKLKKE